MNFKRGCSLISKSISSDTQYTYRKLSVHSKSVTPGCICEVVQMSHFTGPVHSCFLHAGMTKTVWRKNASVKWRSKFEGQDAGAIFMWILKIFYMQLIHCLKWRTVPGWKSGFIALWKFGILLNLTYLLVHLYKYSVAFFISPLTITYFVIYTPEVWGFLMFCFFGVFVLFESFSFCRIFLSFDCFSCTICLITASPVKTLECIYSIHWHIVQRGLNQLTGAGVAAKKRGS